MRILVALSLCVFVVCPIEAAAATADEASDRDAIVAEIDGKPITLAEFEQKRADALFQARTSLYQTERKVLDGFIDEYLLKKEAQRENLTVEQLLQRHVQDKLPKDPTEETLRFYYEGIDTTEPYEAVRDKVLQHFRQRRLDKARAAYLQTLRGRAHIAIKLSAPRIDLRLSNASARGDQNASVTLVEYSDYECPYCQQVEPELKKLEAEYKGKISFVYKDFPLPMHPNAQKAAEAARCAGVQGKFWDYHDLLFATKEFGLPAFKQHARTLNLDATAFDKCLDAGAQAEAVKSDLAEAQRLGVGGTPSFFLNGRYLGSGVTYDTLRKEVEQELAARSSHAKDSEARR